MTNEIRQAPPIASAVVIGLGGSGVHTLARLRAIVRDTSRTDRVAVDNVRFLAIDAVGQNSQLPALPKGTGLSPDEFLNIASTPLNAFEYVRQASQHDEALSASWDTSYNAPNQPLTDGMKRSRALGNLAFRVQAGELLAAVRGTLDAVVALNPGQYRHGSESSKARIPVFIASSCVGGTGSSGFLHVLHAVHRAAKACGVDVAVYPVIFLPDVFMGVRASSLDSRMEERAHQSNAYAFFAEFDYVISEPRAFDELLCPTDAMTTGVRALDVVERAFLIDGRLTDGSQIGQVDAYELAATGLHALLLTETRELLGASGTNTDVKGFDDLEPPQRTAYATMGSFRTVFPGSTYRRFARARMRSHLLQSFVLDDADTTNEVALGKRLIRDLVDGIWGLRTVFDEEARKLRSVQDLQSRVASAESELDDKDAAVAVSEHLDRVLADADEAAKDLVSVMPAQSRAAISGIDGVIDSVLQSSGEGLKVLRYAVNKAQAELSHKATAREAANQSSRQLLSAMRQANRDGSLTDCARRVQQAAGRNFLVRRGELSESINGYSDAASQFASNLLTAHVAQAELDVLKSAVARLEEVLDALDGAAKIIADDKTAADVVWQNDELEGKDAGGDSLMVLVPSDVRPQVEDSGIAKAVWARIERKLEENVSLRRDESSTGREWVRKLYKEWWKQGEDNGVRGLVALGQGAIDAGSQARSAEILERILSHDVEDLTGLAAVMPCDLRAAAAMADAAASGDIYADAVTDGGPGSGSEADQLETALEETLKKSEYVALQIDPARVRLQGGAALPPPLVTVAASGNIMAAIKQKVPTAVAVDSGDPEQVVSLTIRIRLPIGAVRGLDQWDQTHRRVIRDRARLGIRSNDPPPFLDTRLASTVARRPLVRRLYAHARLADLVVQGTALLRMHDETLDVVRSLGLIPPLEVQFKGDKTEVVAHPLTIIDGQVRDSGDAVVLGTDAAEVFDRLAGENAVQNGIEDVFDFVLNRARGLAQGGDSRLLEALSGAVAGYQADNADLARLLPTESPAPETEREREVRRQIDLAAERVAAEVKAAPRPAKPESKI